MTTAAASRTDVFAPPPSVVSARPNRSPLVTDDEGDLSVSSEYRGARVESF